MSERMRETRVERMKRMTERIRRIRVGLIQEASRKLMYQRISIPYSIPYFVLGFERDAQKMRGTKIGRLI